ncbi:nucleotide exchange factor GrpE [Prevotella sp. E13-17]|uniref:nucleotide exchange factor GrpE n=1 Tax=Prevotella sp. E13-17 TaxID=2913616 RepID=UPI001EDC15A5|nr:nucleotide exchange factor GrpE [Prevotella sp. E13-17]UKK50126.1 nucleotide exchange factor GrpE [Prevotella sp. E13-17]
MTEKDINIEEQEQTTDQVAVEKDNSENTTDAESSEPTDNSENAESAETDEKPNEAEQIIADLKDKYLRTMAEFDNFRKRTIKERQELIFNGGKKTITALLPVIDDMERAIENGKKTDDIEVLREGIQLIYQKLMKTLEAQGVTKIDTENADFDTNLHEAVALVPGMGDDKKGKVIDCMATGYKLNDEVIRYAKVAVGQ